LFQDVVECAGSEIVMKSRRRILPGKIPVKDFIERTGYPVCELRLFESVSRRRHFFDFL